MTGFFASIRTLVSTSVRTTARGQRRTGRAVSSLLTVERFEERTVLAAVVPLVDPALTASATSHATAFAFSNWTAISAAIAKVPVTAGPIASATVIDFGRTVYSGPLDVTKTLTRIRNDIKSSLDSNDGTVHSGSIPGLPATGTTWEFVVAPNTGETPSVSESGPGSMRLLLNSDGSCVFTGDHYGHYVGVWKPGTAPLPTISIASASVAEGNSGTKSLSFVVTLSAAAAQQVSFSWSTVNGTATAGSDYVGVTNKTVTIPAGTRSTTLSVTINGDTVVEANETFSVVLSSVTGVASTGNSTTATGTILNDDVKAAAVAFEAPVTRRPAFGAAFAALGRA